MRLPREAISFLEGHLDGKHISVSHTHTAGKLGVMCSPSVLSVLSLGQMVGPSLFLDSDIDHARVCRCCNIMLDNILSALNSLICHVFMF